LTCRIGLPDFQDGVGDDIPIAIENFAANRNALSGYALRHEGFPFEIDHAEMKERTDGL
jgi:hypothetical protein